MPCMWQPGQAQRQRWQRQRNLTGCLGSRAGALLNCHSTTHAIADNSCNLPSVFLKSWSITWPPRATTETISLPCPQYQTPDHREHGSLALSSSEVMVSALASTGTTGTTAASSQMNCRSICTAQWDHEEEGEPSVTGGILLVNAAAEESRLQRDKAQPACRVRTSMCSAATKQANKRSAALLHSCQRCTPGAGGAAAQSRGRRPRACRGWQPSPPAAPDPAPALERQQETRAYAQIIIAISEMEISSLQVRMVWQSGH